LAKASLSTNDNIYCLALAKKIPRQKQENFVEVVMFHADLNGDKKLREKISTYYPFKVKTIKVQILVRG
jgi:hypothetical protein